MALGVIFAIGAVALFWSATRPHRASAQAWRLGWGLLCVTLAVIFFSAPGPAPTWVINAIEGTTLLTGVCIVAALALGYLEQSRDHHQAVADGVPALHPHWPTGLVAGLTFAVCVVGLWLVGTGVQAFEQTALTPLLTALDPAQVNSPDVTHAIDVITAVMMAVVLIPFTLTFAVPLTVAYVHHRRVTAARAAYLRELEDYENNHPTPTGAVSRVSA